MADVNKIDEWWQFADFEVTDAITFPTGEIGNPEYSQSSAHRLVAEKREHQKTIIWSTATTGTGIAGDANHLLFTTNKAGTIEAFFVRPETAPTASNTCTFDLQLAADGSTSYSTVLSAVVSISSTSVSGTKYAGTISSPTLAANDSLRLVIDRTHVDGTDTQGATVTLVIHELPA